MLLERTNLSAIKTELHGQPYARRVQLIAYDGKPETEGRYYVLFPDQDKLVQIEAGSGDRLSRQGSLWAQDLFEVVTGPSGGLILLASEVHKYYYAAGSTPEMKVIRDNVYLARLASLGLEVQALPVTFMGGNILVDVTDGEGVAFCGGDVLRATRTVSRAIFDLEPADRQISDFLREILNVESIVIVGRERPQPYQMFHLDQAMTILPDQVAAITRLVGEDPEALRDHEEIKQVRQFLTELESVLQTLGYRLIYMDTSVGNIMSCQHYVNAIPYVDALTGQRTILMPTFPSSQTEFEEGLVARNTAVLESVGYEVVHVPTAANEARGGIHCLVNVLD
jgi:hypothetical protein